MRNQEVPSTIQTCVSRPRVRCFVVGSDDFVGSPGTERTETFPPSGCKITSYLKNFVVGPSSTTYSVCGSSGYLSGGLTPCPILSEQLVDYWVAVGLAHLDVTNVPQVHGPNR